METLNVTKENAIKAFQSADRKGRKLLQNLFGEKTFIADIKERIKTFDDVLAEANVSGEGLNSLDRLILIHRVFQQGKEYEPHNPNQKKWFPVFDLIKSSSNPSGFRFGGSYYSFTHSYSVLGSLLWLPDEETADYVAKTFENDFKNVILGKNEF